MSDLEERIATVQLLLQQRVEIDQKLGDLLGVSTAGEKPHRAYKKRGKKADDDDPYLNHAPKAEGIGQLNWKSLGKLKELKAAGMSSKDSATEIGKDLELVNRYWANL